MKGIKYLQTRLKESLKAQGFLEPLTLSGTDLVLVVDKYHSLGYHKIEVFRALSDLDVRYLHEDNGAMRYTLPDDFKYFYYKAKNRLKKQEQEQEQEQETTLKGVDVVKLLAGIAGLQDALGVKKFDKDEALEKLETIEADLQKLSDTVSDLVSDLSSNVDSLMTVIQDG